MKTIACLRISDPSKQDLLSQKNLILEYSNKNKFHIDRFIEVEMSSKKSIEQRKIDELVESLGDGDRLIVAELSRLGRSTFETLNIVDRIDKKGAIIEFVRQPEMSTSSNLRPLIVSIFAYLAEAERTYHSMRVRAGLQARKKKGMPVGRQRGAICKSKLDEHYSKIKEMLSKKMSKTSISRYFGVSTSCLYNFCHSRGLLNREE